LIQTKAKRVKREKSTSEVGHYVTNGVLLPEVIKAKELNEVTSELIAMIWMIAERYSRKGNFVNYTFRADMVSTAVENLCKNALNFDLDRSDKPNPFSYYTSAIHNTFLQCIADEKKHRNIRDMLLIDAGSNPSYNFLQGEKDESHFEIKESDEHVEVYNQFLLEAEDEELLQQKVLVDGVLVDVPKAPTQCPVTPFEDRVRNRGKSPSSITTYKAEDIIIDPETGAISIREGAVGKVDEVAALPVKAPPPKRIMFQRKPKPEGEVAVEKPVKVKKEKVVKLKVPKVKKEKPVKAPKVVKELKILKMPKAKKEK
jgi:hypothetical protein